MFEPPPPPARLRSDVTDAISRERTKGREQDACPQPVVVGYQMLKDNSEPTCLHGDVPASPGARRPRRELQRHGKETSRQRRDAQHLSGEPCRSRRDQQHQSEEVGCRGNMQRPSDEPCRARSDAQRQLEETSQGNVQGLPDRPSRSRGDKQRPLDNTCRWWNEVFRPPDGDAEICNWGQNTPSAPVGWGTHSLPVAGERHESPVPAPQWHKPEKLSRSAAPSAPPAWATAICKSNAGPDASGSHLGAFTLSWQPREIIGNHLSERAQSECAQPRHSSPQPQQASGSQPLSTLNPFAPCPGPQPAVSGTRGRGTLAPARPAEGSGVVPAAQGAWRQAQPVPSVCLQDTSAPVMKQSATKQRSLSPFAHEVHQPSGCSDTSKRRTPSPMARGRQNKDCGSPFRVHAEEQSRGRKPARTLSPNVRQLQSAALLNDELTCSGTEWEVDPSELRLEELVGSGTTAEVHRGSWHGTDVAIKKLRQSGPLSVEFMRELSVLVRLRHPNLVLFMGVSTQVPPMIISEFCVGGTVFALIHQRPEYMLLWSQRLKIAFDVAKGMNFLHRRQVVHRDLKSLNLLLASVMINKDDIPAVKISDFGLSRAWWSDQTNSQAFMTSGAGTYHWMAPEVLNGCNYDEKIDVYSYGICLFELLSRRIPYEGSGLEPVSIAIAVSKGCRPDITRIPQDCPADLHFTMECCWAHCPTGRPGFDTILETLRVHCP